MTYAKLLISFIVAVLLIAFFVGQCSDGNDDIDYTETESSQINNYGGKEVVNTNDEDREKKLFDSYSKQIFELINAHRTSIGLSPLTYSDACQELCNEHCVNMANGVTAYGHEGIDSRRSRLESLGYYYIGENVAYNNSSNPNDVITLWLNSSGHRENIENKEYTHAGLKAFKGSSGSIYYTQIFASANKKISNNSPVEQEANLEIPAPIKYKPEQILVREGYTTSYNNETKNANWVAWHLTKDHINGPWSRRGVPYIVDDEVVGARQELEDWHGLTRNLDHGHLCPAGDNKWSEKAMVQSFLLTNMCPQHRNLNNGDWKELEERCRGWAKQYLDIYIVADPIFYNSEYETIGFNKVGVPDAFFKVVLRLGKKPSALGFIYPNEGTHHKMSEYLYSVDEVENITGIDFFYNLSDEVETNVEAESNLKNW